MTVVKQINPGSQQGAILVVSLVILTVMTMIGITAMQTTIMQEKMAGNSRDLNLAFEAAEAANREGENWIDRLGVIPDPLVCNASPCALWNDEDGANALYAASGAVFYTDDRIWAIARQTTHVNPATGAPTLDGVLSPPRYVVEFVEHRRDSQNLGQQSDLRNSRSIYRVTSRGTGGTDAARSFVQSTFAKRF